MPVERTGVRTLAVWYPDWPLVAAGIPATEPAAVFHANRVVACSPAARADGVTRGQRRREAQARCPALVVEAHDPSRDVRAFERVVDAVVAFSPNVELTRPGLCSLATRGPSRYFGGDAALARQVAAAVDAAVADLPGTAGRACRTGIADGPFTAALAARRDAVVSPGESAEFLAPFPATVLGEPALAELLGRLGIRTLGAFAALPETIVEARFGPDGSRAHRLARGLDDRALAAREPRPDLSRVIELDPPVDQVEPAAFAAKAMAGDLSAALEAAGLVCTAIRIESETEHGEQLRRVWRHHRSFTPAAIADRVRWQLEGWLVARTDEGGTSGGLTLVRLVPEEVLADTGRQGGFWGGATAADERAERGLARLQGLLGPDAVLTPVLQGGRGPFEQVRLVPWGEPRDPERRGSPLEPAQPPAAFDGAAGRRVRRRPSRAAAASRSVARAGTRVRVAGRAPSPTEMPVWPGRVPPPAPAFVHREPLAAALTDEDGGVIRVSGRGVLTSAPASLAVAGGSPVAVASWAGPWPVDERWWDGAARRRRARLQVVTADGGARLLCCEGGRWWVEATYD